MRNRNCYGVPNGVIALTLFSLLFVLTGCQVLGPQISYPTSFEWKWEKNGRQYCVQGAVDGFYYMGGSVTGISGV